MPDESSCKEVPGKLTANDNHEWTAWAPSRSRRAKEFSMQEERRRGEGGALWRFLLRSLIKIINESRLLATVAHQEYRRRLTGKRFAKKEIKRREKVAAESKAPRD